MTIRGDMEAYCYSKLGITMTQAREVIDCALEAADCYDFAQKYQQEVGTASGLEDYMDVIKFLRELLK
jgi:hypothetical protein